MIQPEWLNGLLGFLMPLLVRFVTYSEMKRWVKTLVAVFTSIVIGTISVYLQGNFNFQDVFYTITLIFSVSQIAYNLFWKDVLNK
ncbi:MAG: hypothetical protein QW754_05710 [Thermoplasmata archaeon]